MRFIPRPHTQKNTGGIATQKIEVVVQLATKVNNHADYYVQVLPGTKLHTRILHAVNGAFFSPSCPSGKIKYGPLQTVQGKFWDLCMPKTSGAGLQLNPCPNGCRKDNFGRCTNGRCSNYGKKCNGDCKANPKSRTPHSSFTPKVITTQYNPYDLGAQAFGRCANRVQNGCASTFVPGPYPYTYAPWPFGGSARNPGSLAKTPCPAGTVLTPVVKNGKTQLLCRPKPMGLAKTPCPAGTVPTPVVKDGKTQLLCRKPNPQRQANIGGCPTCPGVAGAQKAWNWYNQRHGNKFPVGQRTVITL